MAKAKTLSDWTRLAERRLSRLIKVGQGMPGLGKRLRSAGSWSVDCQMVGTALGRKLNRKFRGKDYATDVLSFPAPRLFRAQGHLGELIICVPVMRRQAQELGHRPEQELEVLLVHGLLHLLDMDHEKGGRAAREMARWEKRLLERSAHAGLIVRSHSGIRKKL